MIRKESSFIGCRGFPPEHGTSDGLASEQSPLQHDGCATHRLPIYGKPGEMDTNERDSRSHLGKHDASSRIGIIGCGMLI